MKATNFPPLRIGVIGTGGITEKMLTLQSPTIRFDAVCSRSNETGQAYAQKHSVPKVYTDIQALVSDPQIDAIYIATPNKYHTEQAEIALRAGKHVLCEKPMGITSASVRHIIDIARTQNLICLEALRTLFNPGFAIVHQTLHEIAPLRRITARYGKYSSRYDRFLAGQTPNAFDPSLGNAALYDLGVYCIAPTLALIDARKPTRINGAHTFLRNGFEAQGTVTADFDTFLADWVYSKISDNRIPSEIQGEKGTLIIHEWDRMDRLHLILRDGTSREITVPTENIDLQYELHAFQKMIWGQIDPSPYNAISIRTAEVMESVNVYGEERGVTESIDAIRVE